MTRLCRWGSLKEPSGGQAPFVLTVRNAKAYFDPSSLVKGCRKRSLRALREIPKLRKRLAKLIEDDADQGFFLR